MKYNNPIIKGFHPDPSICRVGDDYYLVTSSFEYFPGIPVFHSKDLINWKQIGHCITRNDQLTYLQGYPNCTGIYAPTIRYHEGIFYVITTNVAYGDKDDGNFVVWTKNPYGEWSDPIKIETPGIDPSLYFDEDGKVYYIGAHEGIFLYEINLKNGELIGDRKNIWQGTGGAAPEGPHIYKVNGWYYLMIAEGGTEYGHMVTIARSKGIEGPYVSCPHNPVLTNRSLSTPIKAVGHADMFEDKEGNWWVVCLGIRTIGYPFRHNLGRETMLAPVIWDKEGWPIMGDNGVLREYFEVDTVENECIQLSNNKMIRDEFVNGAPSFDWNYLYNPVTKLFSMEKGNKGISLYGSEASLSDSGSLAWIGRRQEEHNFVARTYLKFDPVKNGEEAGVTIYMNNRHHYEVALVNYMGKVALLFSRRIGSLWKVEAMIPYEKKEVILEIEGGQESYLFRYGETIEDMKMIGEGETCYLTTEVGGMFTGNYIALYATGNGVKCESEARFEWFEMGNISE